MNESGLPEELQNIGVEGNTLEDTSDIEQELMNTEWYQEAQHIPLEALTPLEQILMKKYQNQETLTVEEDEQIKQILSTYRPAIQKHKPQETIKNFENNLEYNKAEKSFLELLQQQRKEKTLTMHYPLDDGTTYELKLKIKRADAQTITDLQTNFKLFSDLTQTEDNVRIKQQQGVPLTREEQIILQNINKKINAKVMANQDQMMIEFLATHTLIIGEEADENYMKQIYQSMDPTLLIQLFTKVSQLSGLTNPNMDELFQ